MNANSVNNRAERRRQERESRKSKKPIPAIPEDMVLKRYTQAEFGQLIYDTEFSARAHATEMMIVAYSLAEHRLYKHGKTRVKRTYDYVASLMNDINEGRVTYAELKQQCTEETGVKFDF